MASAATSQSSKKRAAAVWEALQEVSEADAGVVENAEGGRGVAK